EFVFPVSVFSNLASIFYSSEFRFSSFHFRFSNFQPRSGGLLRSFFRCALAPPFSGPPTRTTRVLDRGGPVVLHKEAGDPRQHVRNQERQSDPPPALHAIERPR